MKWFTRQETKALIIIFSVLIVISVPNFLISIRRARDQVRRDDMGAIQKGLDDFLAIYKVFPISSPDGKIIGCFDPGETAVFDKFGHVTNFKECQWGKSQFSSLKILPGDPDSQKNVSYRYIGDGERYILYAAMEGKDEPEYKKTIEDQKVSCGVRLCNIERSFGYDNSN